MGNKHNKVTTNILGTDYEIQLDDLNSPELANADGQCFLYDKRIIIRKPEYLLSTHDNDDNKRLRFQEVLTHELIHGYCRESVVFYDDDENLVNWIALMLPKIIKSYDEVLEQLKELESEGELNV